MKFALACVLVFAILGFLRCCEGSPVRTWKAVFISGTLLCIAVCYYLNWAYPPPPPLPPRAEKVALNKAELERTFRHIAGVHAASIEGSVVRLDFREDKPMAELRRIALSTCGTAAHFLGLHETNRMSVFITVNGRQRIALVYDTRQGVMEEIR